MTQEEFDIFTIEYDEWIDEGTAHEEEAFQSYMTYLEDQTNDLVIYDKDDFFTPTDDKPLKADILLKEMRQSLSETFEGEEKVAPIDPTKLNDELLLTICQVHAQSLGFPSKADELVVIVRGQYAYAN